MYKGTSPQPEDKTVEAYLLSPGFVAFAVFNLEVFVLINSARMHKKLWGWLSIIPAKSKHLISVWMHLESALIKHKISLSAITLICQLLRVAFTSPLAERLYVFQLVQGMCVCVCVCICMRGFSYLFKVPCFRGRFPRACVCVRTHAPRTLRLSVGSTPVPSGPRASVCSGAPLTRGLPPFCVLWAVLRCGAVTSPSPGATQPVQDSGAHGPCQNPTAPHLQSINTSAL